MILVRHLKLSRGMQNGFYANDMYEKISFRADKDAVRHALEMPNFWEKQGLTYETVAEVATHDLDYAFERTNSINRSWQENWDVTPRPGSHRSTSVGDLMQRGGKTYMVAKMGFEEIVV